MAYLIDKILGGIRGSIKDLTFYMKNGKQYVKSRKHKHAKSFRSSLKAKKNRLQFAQSHYFSKTLCKDIDIKMFWETLKLEGSSAYFKAHSYNRKRCTHENVTVNNGITPEGIPVNVKNISLSKNVLSFDFEILRSNDSEINPPYTVYAFLYLNEGTVTMKNQCFSAHLKSVDILEEGNGLTHADIVFADSLIARDIPECNHLFVFIAAIKHNGLNFEWTSSFCKKFDISAYSAGYHETTVITSPEINPESMTP